MLLYKVINNTMFGLNLFKFSRRAILFALIVNIAFIIMYVTPLLAADAPSVDAGLEVSKSFDKIWKQLLLNEDGKTTLFTVLCKALTSFAILAIGWETAYLIAKSSAADDPRSFVREFVIGKMLPTALVALAVGNNGYLAGHLLYASKSMFMGIDKAAYESLLLQAGTASLVANAGSAESVLTPISEGFENCSSIPDRIGGKVNPQFLQCLQGLGTTIDTAVASGKVQDSATLAKLTKSRGILNTAISSDNPAAEYIKSGAALRGALNQASMSGWIEGTIEGLLTAIGSIYYVVVEIAFLIMAISSSIALMLSFLKIDVLLNFLPQFVNIFVAKLSYTVAMGLSVIMMNSAGGDLGKWAASLLLGLGCPWISIYIMLALSGSISSVFQSNAMNLAGAGVRGAGKAGSAAIGGAKRAGSMLGGMSRRGGGSVGSSGAAGGMRQISGGAAAGSGSGPTIDVVARRV
jgi:hypothetical protein